MMVYRRSYDQSAYRQVSDRADRPPPGVFVPGRDFRHRSRVQQHRGMVAVDSGRGAAAQGPAVLSLARGKFRDGIRRLCLRAESAARRFRRADPPFAGRRDLCEGQVRRLPSAQPIVELGDISGKQKRRPTGRLSFALSSRLLRSGVLLLHVLELLALLVGALLQLFLQLLLVLLEHLRIGRRAVIGLGELARQRQRQRQRRAIGVDRLHHQVLALLQTGDRFRRRLIVRHAAVLEADHVRRLLRLVAVDDDTGAVDQLHAERQRHAQDLLGLALRLDDHGGDHGLAGLDAAVLAGEADLLGAGFLALEAELRPRRVDQLDLLFLRLRGGLGLGGLTAGRRRLLGRRRALRCRLGGGGGGSRSLRRGLGRGGSRSAGSRRWRLGLGRGYRQRGQQSGRRRQGERPPTRPDRGGQDTEIHCGKPFLKPGARTAAGAKSLRRFGRLSLSQLRRLRDSSGRLDQLPAFNTAASEKINADNRLGLTSRRCAQAYDKALR